MGPTATSKVIKNPYQQDLANYWNTKTQDHVNLRLGEVDGLYHHHYGIGDYDPSVLDGAAEGRDERIIRELHRLETAQANVLLDALGPVEPGDRLLDGGSGRGGTSIMAHDRFGCAVDGVTISEYQVAFANEQVRQRGCESHVQFHLRNMLDTGFPDGSYHRIWTNETTMYVDLNDLYREFARLLEPGGRYVCITGCFNDLFGRPSEWVDKIDEHYICKIHPRSQYFSALSSNGLVPIEVTDLTAATIPYWELRARSSVATGIEDPFLNAYREGSFQYLMIVADRA